MALFYPKDNSGKDLNQNNHINTSHENISQDDDDYIYETESQELRKY